MIPKRIVNEPARTIRQSAREAMKGRMSLLVLSAILYMLCISLPVVIVEQITGLWQTIDSIMDEMMAAYEEMFTNPASTALFDLAQRNSGTLTPSLASFIFLLLVPGPLTLGLSTIWLRVLRRDEAYADMVFSGFGNFARVVVMDTLRRIVMALFAILFIIPGVFMYYRYNLVFFLLADNPDMKPLEALGLSRFYMQQNKGNRFVLDLTFIGWFAVSCIAYYFIVNGVSYLIQYGENNVSIFVAMLVSVVLSSVIFAPLLAYRGVAAAEYYHRVICRDPQEKRPLPAPRLD